MVFFYKQFDDACISAVNVVFYEIRAIIKWTLSCVFLSLKTDYF